MADPAGTAALASQSSGEFWLQNIFGGYSAWQTAQGLRQYGDYQQDAYKMNARLAQVQARDAIFRGQQAARRYGEQAAKFLGTQRVRAAAQGISVSEGSPAELQAETVRISMMDALQIENNAWREAMGYRAQAAGELAKGAMARARAQTLATETLTTRAVQIAGNVMGRYQGEGGGRYSWMNQPIDIRPPRDASGEGPEGVEIDTSSREAFFRTKGQYYRYFTTMTNKEILSELKYDWEGTPPDQRHTFFPERE